MQAMLGQFRISMSLPYMEPECLLREIRDPRRRATENIVFWDVMPRSQANLYRYFGEK
jgi:hypothetical protein